MSRVQGTLADKSLSPLMAHKKNCPNFWEGIPVPKGIKFDIFSK